MGQLKPSHFLNGMSGKMKDVVFKKYDNKTIVSTIPDMSNRILSEKQKASILLMKSVTDLAKRVTADPAIKQQIAALYKVPVNKVFRAIVKDYMLTKGQSTMLEQIPQNPTQ